MSYTQSPKTMISVPEAVDLLKKDGVVGIPTETVYGLAARISSDTAIRKIFTTKERPFFDPLIVHVADIDQAKRLVRQWPPSAQLLSEKFWPGPLTLVLPKNNSVSDLITSGLETVALRCPRHKKALELISILGEPIAAPSANKFGRTSPSTAGHVNEEFSGLIPVIDGGPCEVGIESTIIKVVEIPTSIEVTVLRAGSILPEQIRSALEPLGLPVTLQNPGKNIEAPGQIRHHYMPSIPLIFIEAQCWNTIHKKIDSLNQKLKTSFKNLCHLELSHSPEQAARELYGSLRLCSAGPHDGILFVREAHHRGESWAALLDRLNRAASYHLTEE